MNTNWLSMQIQLIPSPPAEISNNGTFYAIQATLIILIRVHTLDHSENNALRTGLGIFIAKKLHATPKMNRLGKAKNIVTSHTLNAHCLCLHFFFCNCHSDWNEEEHCLYMEKYDQLQKTLKKILYANHLLSWSKMFFMFLRLLSFANLRL